MGWGLPAQPAADEFQTSDESVFGFRDCGALPARPSFVTLSSISCAVLATCSALCSGLRVPSVKVALEAAAEADRRPVASMVEKILVEWLQEHGYMPKYNMV